MSTGCALIAAFLTGCRSMPPERVERDRVILAAVQPCKERYAERLYNTNMMSVYPNGTVRFWYKGDLPRAADDIQGCINEHTKGLKLGPHLPGRLVKPGPADVPITAIGKEVVVPVRINGILGAMAVRTGADFTFVSPGYAKRAGVQVIAESPTTRVTSAGKSSQAPYARVRALEVGNAQVEALDVVIFEAANLDASVDGILGKNFLSHFKVDINRAEQRVTLAPPAPKGGSAR
jgi:hypothetical protein